MNHTILVAELDRRGADPSWADVIAIDPLYVPETDEEPWDITEGAVVYTARWLRALVFVAALLVAVLVVRRLR